jgi:hypothetical protein
MMGVGLGVSRLLHGRHQAQAPAPCQSKGGTHSRPLGLHVHHPLPDPFLTITVTITSSTPANSAARWRRAAGSCSPIALPWPLTIASCTCDHSTAHVLAAIIAQDQHVHPSDSQSSQHSRQPGSPHRMATSPVQCSTLEPPIPCRRRILLT